MVWQLQFIWRTLIVLAGSWQDSADDRSAGLHEALQEHGQSASCHRAQIHSQELDERVREVVSFYENLLYHWR